MVMVANPIPEHLKGKPKPTPPPPPPGRFIRTPAFFEAMFSPGGFCNVCNSSLAPWGKNGCIQPKCANYYD